jgi:hypothetical protein
MKAACTKFKSEGETTPIMQRGSDMHEELAKILEGKNELAFSSLDAGEQDEVSWAADYIQRQIALKGDVPLKVEEKVSYSDESFRELFYGTLDCSCGNALFDLKTGEERSYWHQMAAYGLALMESEGYEEIEVHLVFSRYKRTHTYTISKDEATMVIKELLVRLEDPNAPPIPNAYCGWCDEQTSCPAIVERVMELSKEEDWRLESYNLEEIKYNPDELAKAIALATQMKSWAFAMLDFAKSFEEIPGYEWRHVQGRRKIEDTKGAVKLLEEVGVPIEVIMEVCSVNLSSLEDLLVDFKDLTKPEAKKLLANLLEPVITRAEGYKKLVENKSTKPKELT